MKHWDYYWSLTEEQKVNLVMRWRESDIDDLGGYLMTLA